MGMVVQHNMNAINAYNKLNVNVSGLKKSSEKLSSGYRINRAGDDAAGLAISEKMRSQIRGLNQAVRNSQDGINMIQTFEGAAQETHNILQRMKELAMESANGTYDNATDRAAIQLEFDQLNDELNQIADTDFNGTVVLNGGQMADGLKEVNGEFDYVNKKEQVIRQAQDMLRGETADATKAYGDALKTITGKPNDLSANGAAPEWNSVDENNYNKVMADNLWKAMGITNAKGNADTTKCNELEMTFEYDGTNWVVKSITGNNGVDYTNKKTAVTVTDNVYNNVDNTTKGGSTTANDTTKASGLGGIQVKLATAAGNNEVGGYGEKAGALLNNAIFDATTLAKGDTITLIYTNSDNVTHAPTNVGWADDTYNDARVYDGTSTGAAMKIKLPAMGTAGTTTPSATSITDTQMTEDIAKAYAALNGAKVEMTYADGTTAGQTLTIGGTEVAADSTAGGINATDANTMVHVNGYDFMLKGLGGTDLKTGDLTGVEIYDTKGTQLLATISFDADIAQTGADPETAGMKGSVSATIAVDTPAYTDNSAAVDIRAGKNDALTTTDQLQKTMADAQKKLSELSKIKVTDFASAKEYLTKRGVSISDAYDNSTARMTYTDNITLQTGARTKDGVNFTFNYNTEGTADMGALKANLNLSSREDGLNTANLSLANQKDANYAIDQIDKAINKTSMVRATFGSIQNRLEHKITNLTTTSENLTEAESSIRDTDMASEMMNYTKFNILQQAAQSMLAQANQQPQSILQLLG